MPTLNLQVGLSSGDAEGTDNGAQFNATSSVNRMAANGNVANRWLSGAHYPSVAIAPGSTINSATGRLYFYTATQDDPSGQIRMELLVSPQNFVDNAVLHSRARTTNFTVWEAADLPINQYQTTPEFAAVLQEIIDQPGWASGNPATVLYIGKSSGTGEARWRSWDHTNALAPRLDITFTAPAAGEILFRSTDKGMDRGTDRGIG